MWHLSKAVQTWHILLYLQALNVSPVRWSFLLCWHDKHLPHRGEIHLQFLIVSLSQCHVIIIIIIMLCTSREKVIDGSAKLISVEEGFPLVSDSWEIAQWACLLRVRNGGMSVSRRLRPTGGVSCGHPKTAKYTPLRREEMAEWSNFREMNDGGGSFYEKMRDPSEFVSSSSSLWETRLKWERGSFSAGKSSASILTQCCYVAL